MSVRLALAALAALAGAGCASALAQNAQSTSYADYLIGSYAERAKDPVGAAERFASALRTSPRDPLLLEGAADAALMSGDVTAAAQLGAQARRVGRQTASGRLAMAALALRAGKPGEAQRLSTGVEGAPVDQIVGRLLEVWAQAGARKTDAALATLGDFGGAPRSPWTALQYAERAMVLDLAGRGEDALAAYAQAEETGGLRMAQLVLLRGALMERLSKQDEARALYRSFLESLDNPGVQAALDRLDRGGAPAPLTATRGAAVSLFAVAVLVGQEPTNQEQLTPLALAMALDGDLESARLGFADVMRALGRGDVGRARLAEIPRASPYYETAQAQIAASLRQDGQTDAALGVLTATVADTHGRLARRALADTYRALGRYAEAEGIYGQLISELPELSRRDWRLLFAQGATLHRLGRWPEAEAALKKALEVSPDQPEVLNYLGYQWVDGGVKVQDGLALVQRAVEQRPQDGYIIDSLGWAYFRLGQYDKAIEILERAIELSPGDAELNGHLGDAYWRAGRRIEARYQWRRVLTLSPTEEERAAAETRIANGLPPAP